MDQKRGFLTLVDWGKKNKIWVGGVFLFLLFFFIFYPPFWVSIDEHEYLKNAHLLVENGTLFTSEPSLYCGGTLLENGQSISSYSIGRSIFLIPFTFLPFGFIFLSGLFLHLLNLVLLTLILRRKGVPSPYALLYLFFPLAAWEARTLFPELAVLSLFLSAYYFWSHQKMHTAFIAGLVVGFSVFFRIDAVLGPLAFFIHALFRERRLVLPLIAGGLLPALLFFGFNTTLYGSPFSTGYGSALDQVGVSLNPEFFINLFTYLPLLFLALPFSLYAALKDRNDWVFFSVLIGGTVLFFSHFTNFWHFPFSIPLTFTARLRYFLPLLGLLFIPTLTLFHQWYSNTVVRKKIEPYLHVGILIFFLMAGIGLVALNHSHYQLAAPRAEVGEWIHSTIPSGATVIGTADDCIYFLPPIFGEKYYHKVDQIQSTVLPSTYYVLEIEYLSQTGKDGVRQETVAAERKKLSDFIAAHAGELTPVLVKNEQYHLTIWKKGESGK